MPKKILFLVILAVFISFGLLFAVEETITFSTYYPSPSGSYNEMEVYTGLTLKPHSGVDNDYISTNPSLTCDESKDGMLTYGKYSSFLDPNRYYYCHQKEGSTTTWEWVEQNIERYPHSYITSPTTCNPNTLGKIVFDTDPTANKPYYCASDGWKEFSGGNPVTVIKDNVLGPYVTCDYATKCNIDQSVCPSGKRIIMAGVGYAYTDASDNYSVEMTASNSYRNAINSLSASTLSYAPYPNTCGGHYWHRCVGIAICQ